MDANPYSPWLDGQSSRQLMRCHRQRWQLLARRVAGNVAQPLAQAAMFEPTRVQ